MAKQLTLNEVKAFLQMRDSLSLLQIKQIYEFVKKNYTEFYETIPTRADQVSTLPRFATFLEDKSE